MKVNSYFTVKPYSDSWKMWIEEDNPEFSLGMVLRSPLLCNKQVTRVLVQFHSQQQFTSLKPFHTLLLFLGRLLGSEVWNRLANSWLVESVKRNIFSATLTIMGAFDLVFKGIFVRCGLD